MAAGDPILDLSDLIYLQTGGTGGVPDQINFFKTGLRVGAAPTAPVAGRLHSLWRWDGQPGGAANTNPTTAVVPTNATAGSLQQVTPATSAKKYIVGVVLEALVPGTVVFYDRVGEHGGLSGTVTTAQTTNLPTAALTRYTTGEGVEAWLEIYTIIGTTGTTTTMSYTNQAGTTGQTSLATSFGATGLREVDRQIPQALASGQRGVRAVASVTVLATTGTAGAFGVTLAYPVLEVPLALAGVGTLWSAFLQPGGPLSLGVNSNAALATSWFANGTTAPSLFGHLYAMEK